MEREVHIYKNVGGNYSLIYNGRLIGNDFPTYNKAIEYYDKLRKETDGET